MAVVYKATNKINGKIYIGFAQQWPRRQFAHKTKAKNGSPHYFHNAIRKYGWDSFQWDILKENATLDDEKALIAQYRANILGYNLTVGGEGITGYNHTDDAKKKIGKSSRARNLQKWIVTSPSNETILVTDLKEFCLSNSLNYQSMWNVANGKKKKDHIPRSHKGFKIGKYIS